LPLPMLLLLLAVDVVWLTAPVTITESTHGTVLTLTAAESKMLAGGSAALRDAKRARDDDGMRRQRRRAAAPGVRMDSGGSARSSGRRQVAPSRGRAEPSAPERQAAPGVARVLVVWERKTNSLSALARRTDRSSTAGTRRSKAPRALQALALVQWLDLHKIEFFKAVKLMQIFLKILNNCQFWLLVQIFILQHSVWVGN